MKKPTKKTQRKAAAISPKALSAQHDRFCQEYIIDYNQTKAATRAGYSEKSAAVTGHRLLRNDKILARVRELQKEQRERLAITADWVILQLRKVVEKAIQDVPVLAYDPDAHELKETGEYQFDSRGATKALELMGKTMGMFEEKINLNGDVDFRVTIDYGQEEGDAPESSQARKAGFGQ